MKEQQMTTNALESLKVGDRVIVEDHEWYGKGRVEVVSKVTPKQVVVGRTRFWKANGRELTSGYHAERIKVATEEAVTAIELEAKRSDLLRTARDWFSCYQRPQLHTTEELEAIGAVIAAAKARIAENGVKP